MGIAGTLTGNTSLGLVKITLGEQVLAGPFEIQFDRKLAGKPSMAWRFEDSCNKWNKDIGGVGGKGMAGLVGKRKALWEYGLEEHDLIGLKKKDHYMDVLYYREELDALSQKKKAKRAQVEAAAEQARLEQEKVSLFTSQPWAPSPFLVLTRKTPQALEEKHGGKENLAKWRADEKAKQDRKCELEKNKIHMSALLRTWAARDKLEPLVRFPEGYGLVLSPEADRWKTGGIRYDIREYNFITKTDAKTVRARFPLSGAFWVRFVAVGM